MTGRHAHRRILWAWRPEDERGGEDFPVTAEDAARFAALAEEYRALARAADDRVTRGRLGRAARAYAGWAAKGPAPARRSNA